SGLGIATGGGALLGGALGAGFGAWAGLRAKPVSPEDAALRTAIRAARVKADADVRHRNAAMAEQLGWEEAQAAGEIGIQGPGKVTDPGPDFLTYDPKADVIKVWDSKYNTNPRTHS